MSRRRRIAALVPALGLLIVVWSLLKPARVPLYDGIYFPTYRYLHTPPDQPNNGPPHSARVTISILDGQSSITKIHTPVDRQAYLILQYRALRVAPATHHVALTITAVHPPTGPPKHRVIDGNVYRFAATTRSGSQVALRAGLAIVELAGTGASGTATLARYGAGHWILLPTVALTGASQGYYAARAPALGDFTLILLPRKTSVLSEALPFIVAGVLVVLLLAVGIFLIRSGRARETQTP